jgi:hypothetical protein
MVHQGGRYHLPDDRKAEHCRCADAQCTPAAAGNHRNAHKAYQKYIRRRAPKGEGLFFLPFDIQHQKHCRNGMHKKADAEKAVIVSQLAVQGYHKPLKNA